LKKTFFSIILAALLILSTLLSACNSGNTEQSGESGSAESSESESISSNTESSKPVESVNENSKADASDVSDEGSETDDEIMNNEPVVRPTGYPTLSGSFMQPPTFKNYTPERMKKHLNYMKEVGIDTVILQWTFETEGGKVLNSYFDSSFDSSEKVGNFDASGKNLLDTLLSSAEELGMKVFVGLNDSAEWWNIGVSDKGWLTTQSKLGVKGARQIYDTYKEKYPNALHGWYFTFEFYNMNAPEAFLDNAAYLLSEFRNGLYGIDGDMPMMLSPYISSAGASAADTGKMWTYVFSKASFREGDIFCCQDSVGARHITIDRLDEYFKAIKGAIDTVKGLHFWANNEDFAQESWGTAPLDRFIEQLNISDKYVEAHVTFAYSHYQNPDVGKTGYHLAYKEYFKTGKIPETSLAKPNVEFAVESNGALVKISGSIANPDKTALGFNVYKNGELIKQIDLSSDYGKAELKFSLEDTNITGAGSAKYKICAVDYYNNESPDVEFTVDFKGKNGKNVALGKSYTATVPAEANYPDDGNKSLTDGKLGQPAYYDPAWSGYLGKPEFIIDLGKTENGIYAIDVSTLGGGSAGVSSPNEITVFVSNDGASFTQVLSKKFENDTGTDDSKTIVRNVVLNESISGRYVKIAIATNQSWIFLDEISVYAE
jgi:hypothetical protein